MILLELEKDSVNKAVYRALQGIKQEIRTATKKEVGGFFNKRGEMYFNFSSPTRRAYSSALSNVRLIFNIETFSGTIIFGHPREVSSRGVKYDVLNMHNKGIGKAYYIRPRDASKWLVFEHDPSKSSRNPNKKKSPTFVKNVNGKNLIFTKEVYRTPKEGIKVGDLMIGHVKEILHKYLGEVFVLEIERMVENVSNK